MFLQQLMNALAIGAVYGLTAMGATLIYGILGILDIANAGAYLIGAYIGWFIYYSLAGSLGSTAAILIAFVVSVAVVSLIGILLQRSIYSPILAKSKTISIIPLVAAVGLFTMSSDLMRLIFGPKAKSYQFDFFGFGRKPIILHYGESGKVAIQPGWLLIFAMTAILLFVLWFILNKTKIGLAWRATANDSEIARVCGVNTNHAMALSYTLGYGMAAIAGMLVGILNNTVTTGFAEVPSYKMLAIIVLGGLGSPLGTVLAGLFIGLAEVMLSVYAPWIPIPKDAIAFVVLIVMLLIKPSGLMGRKNRM